MTLTSQKQILNKVKYLRDKINNIIVNGAQPQSLLPLSDAVRASMSKVQQDTPIDADSNFSEEEKSDFKEREEEEKQEEAEQEKEQMPEQNQENEKEGGVKEQAQKQEKEKEEEEEGEKQKVKRSQNEKEVGAKEQEQKQKLEQQEKGKENGEKVEQREREHEKEGVVKEQEQILEQKQEKEKVKVKPRQRQIQQQNEKEVGAKEQEQIQKLEQQEKGKQRERERENEHENEKEGGVKEEEHKLSQKQEKVKVTQRQNEKEVGAKEQEQRPKLEQQQEKKEKEKEEPKDQDHHVHQPDVEQKVDEAERIPKNNPKANDKPNINMLWAFVVLIITIFMGTSLVSKFRPNLKADFELNNPLQMKLINLHSDFSQMPECSEKNLLRLIFFTSVKTLSETQFLSDRGIHLPDNLIFAITEEFQALSENLRKEELDFDKKQELQLLEIKAKVKNKNWEAASEELDTLLREIRPLDTNELYRLITKSNETASLIKDQEIVFFLGPSGSGKSTTIHFLGGSDMGEIKEGEIDHIAPIKIKNPELKKVFTSATSTSQTKYITPVPVNLQDVDKKLMGKTILCDSPGFEDTNGAEVDIANGVGIIKALQACKSVKPIVVISSQSFGDKLTRLKDIMKTIAGMIPDLKDKGDTFLYFFTKFSEKEKKQITAKLSDLRKTLTASERSDTNLVDFINNMIEKTKTELITINPIHDNPGILLKKLQESSSISHPGQAFQYSITQNSQLIIKAQAERHQSSIKSSIDRFDFLLAKYKLDDLKKLYEILQYDHINTTYTHCVNYYTKKLNESFKAAIANLNKCFVEQNSFTVDDIIEYKEHIERAYKADGIINEHLGNKAITASDLLQNIQQETDKILQNLNTKTVDDAGVGIFLDKLKLISTHFSQFSSSYDEGYKIVKKKIADTVSTFQNFIDSDQFEKCANEMQMIVQAKSILKYHMSNTYLDKTYEELQKSAWSSLNNCTDGPSSVFGKEVLSGKDVFALKTCISRIEAADKTPAFKTHMSTNNMNKLYSSLFERLLGHSKEVDSKMTAYFTKENANSFQKLEQLMEEMILILTIPSIDSEIMKNYYMTLRKLENAIRESKAQMERLLSLIPQDEPDLKLVSPSLQEPVNNVSQENGEPSRIFRFFWPLGCALLIIFVI